MKKAILTAATLIIMSNAQAYSLFSLYAEIMPAEMRSQQPLRTLKSFMVHTQDSYKNFPNPSDIQGKNILPISGVRNFTGYMTYVGVVPKKYTYDVFFDGQKHIFSVRIYLKNATIDDSARFSQMLLAAEKEWNASREPTDFSYEFRFSLVDNPSLAHYRVKVLDDTRGPYDTNWGRNWTQQVIAHEIGHMLGLGDEYETLTSTSDCLEISKMCDSWHGIMMKHHYYFVLRRLIGTVQ